ncbi:hypothetical protein AHAS_Ahas15G0253500 [Arachis hypogaea]
MCLLCCREKEIEKTPIVKRKQPGRVAKKQTKSGSLTEQEKDSAAERRRHALEMLREKRSKRRNDGSQTANVAPDRFDSTEARNDFSEILPTVNLGSEPILQTQTSSTLSVNTDKPLFYDLSCASLSGFYQFFAHLFR